MIKYVLFFSTLFFACSCNEKTNGSKTTTVREQNPVDRFYSTAVGDSFSVFVKLPGGYDSHDNKKYPVVFLLDANLYFDIMATMISKYAEVGLAPEVILVGIGYRDFPAMDSLRNRDYTFPVAIPEYEMTTSGGADKFLSFISRQLVPHLDSSYKTDATSRLLLGHSLGGYFATYALLEQLSGRDTTFSGFVAASPSLHYNNYYLLNRLKQLPVHQNSGKKLKTYIAYGGLEDHTDTQDPGAMTLASLSSQLANIFSSRTGTIIYKYDVYSGLDHMDTQVPGFIKGLQWIISGR